jgi:hypothetical protein
MPIEFSHLHNLLRTYQRSLHVNESVKRSVSGTDAEMDDHVSISDHARDEHRQKDNTMDLDPQPPQASEQT